MKVLLTGFEPFGEFQINPSQNLIESTPIDVINNIQFLKRVLPVDTEKAPHQLVEAITAHSPDAVLAFGLASGRPKISLERIAVNLLDFRVPDNAGVKVSEQPVVIGGPAAYFTTLPVREILYDLTQAGIPAELSLSAGTYLCNQVFYTLMHHIETQDLPIQGGFIHLPAQPEQAARMKLAIPVLDLDIDRLALRIILSRLLDTHTN